MNDNTYGHNFIEASYELCVSNALIYTHDAFFECTICNLLAFKIVNDIYGIRYCFIGHGIRDSALIKINCDEYRIKKILE